MIHYKRCANCWGVELPDRPHVCPTLSDVSRREKAKIGPIQQDVAEDVLDTAEIAFKHNVAPSRVREIACTLKHLPWKARQNEAARIARTES